MSEDAKPIHHAIEKLFPCECLHCRAAKELYADAATSVTDNGDGTCDIILNSSDLEMSICTLALSIAARLQLDQRPKFMAGVQNILTRMTIDVVTGAFDWDGQSAETKH